MITEAQVWNAIPSWGFVREYVEYASQRTDANVAFHMATAITLLTQAVPLDYAVPYAAPLYGNTFSLVVGDSGSRKTAAIAIGQKVLRDAFPGAEVEVPGSQEALYDGLRGQQRQLIVYGEFGEFLAKSEQGYMMPLKTAYTNLWDCMPIGRALANKRQGPVRDPRLSLLCGVATDLLERHTEMSDWTGGFMARFFTIHAKPERVFPVAPIDDPRHRQSIVRYFQQIGDAANTTGMCHWLDPTGVQIWTDWWDTLKPIREGGNRRAAAACNRITSIAAKIALLLAWDIGDARSGYDWYVKAPELESALKIANLHLQSVMEIAEMIAGSKDMRERATVLRAIGDGLTPFGVIIRNSDLLKRRVKEILDSLMEERSIECVQVLNETCYRKTPHRHAQLVQMAQVSAQQAVGQSNNVIALAPPPVVAAPVPFDEAIDLGLDDDDPWAYFQG